MKLLIILLLVSSIGYSQKDSTSNKGKPKEVSKEEKNKPVIPKVDTTVNNTTFILSVNDINFFLTQKFIKDMRSEDVDNIRAFLQEMIDRRFTDLKKPKP